MRVYQPGQNGDAELLAWYLRLVTDNELEKIFGTTPQPVAGFLSAFTASDVTLFYDADDQGWWVVSWVKPFLAGASWGLWIRADRRGQAEQVEFVRKVHELAFQCFPVLVFSTHQAAVADSAARLGYTDLGRVPDLFGAGLTAHLLYLHRDDFARTQALWENRRRHG
jgi:hypothetical protein